MKFDLLNTVYLTVCLSSILLSGCSVKTSQDTETQELVNSAMVSNAVEERVTEWVESSGPTTTSEYIMAEAISVIVGYEYNVTTSQESDSGIINVHKYDGTIVTYIIDMDNSYDAFEEAKVHVGSIDDANLDILVGTYYRDDYDNLNVMIKDIASDIITNIIQDTYVN